MKPKRTGISFGFNGFQTPLTQVTKLTLTALLQRELLPDTVLPPSMTIILSSRPLGCVLRPILTSYSVAASAHIVPGVEAHGNDGGSLLNVKRTGQLY